MTFSFDPFAGKRRAQASLPGDDSRWTSRVLFVSYTFPPVGGAGVQRVAKFVKYLPEAGWGASVLTASNPSVPVMDDSLAAEIPPDTLIRTAATWEPPYERKQTLAGRLDPGQKTAGGLARGLLKAAAGFVLQPDPQVLWYRNAVREGRRLLREVPHRVVVATGPPFSSFLIGLALSRAAGLPLVLDYRDEWDLSHAYLEHRTRTAWASLLKRRLQRRALRAASAVITTSEPSAHALRELCAAAGSDAVVAPIYNGFDPDDFASATPVERNADRYRLAYVGTLWALTSVAPLVDALSALQERRPDLARLLEIVIAGRQTPDQQQVLGRLDTREHLVVRRGYIPHDEAIGLMQSADGLCVLMADLPGAARVVPAKVFEYMAARKPILAIAPKGELWDLLRGYPRASLFVPGDTDGIAGYLAREAQSHVTGGAPATAAWDVSLFDRRARARQLATVLDSACRGEAPAVPTARVAVLSESR